MADPWNISLLQAFPPQLSREPERPTARPEVSHSDPLSLLPYDIAVTIFHLISTRDLHSLRLASRWMNHMPIPATIYKEIIREELLVHDDIDWDSPSMSDLDAGYWKTLLLHLRSDKGIQNRLRISRIMRNMALDLSEQESGVEFPEDISQDELETLETIAFSNVPQGYAGTMSVISSSKLRRPKLCYPGGPVYFNPELTTEIRVYSKSSHWQGAPTISQLSFFGSGWEGAKSFGLNSSDTTEEVWTLNGTLKGLTVGFDDDGVLCGLRVRYGF